MITEDFCSYELSKLLKEKGFDVKPYHQYYVSRCGKVFGCKGNEMKQTITNRGYKRITLSINGKEERWSVHRLVAYMQEFKDRGWVNLSQEQIDNSKWNK